MPQQQLNFKIFKEILIDNFKKLQIQELDFMLNQTNLILELCCDIIKLRLSQIFKLVFEILNLILTSKHFIIPLLEFLNTVIQTFIRNSFNTQLTIDDFILISPGAAVKTLAAAPLFLFNGKTFRRK